MRETRKASVSGRRWNPVTVGSAWLTCLFYACAPQPAPPPETESIPTDPSPCVVETVTAETRGESQFQGVTRDGAWLIYAWDDGEDAAGNPLRGTERLNLATGERVPLPDAINNGGSPSPDGATLVGATYTEERTEIFEHDLETGNVDFIAPDPG